MKKLREIHLEININKSKDQVWDLLFNKFGEVNLFNPVIESSHHTKGEVGEVGCERQCDINSTTSVHEKITAARGNDSFDVDIVKGGLPMMDQMKATWDLKEISKGQTRAKLTMYFNTKPAIVGAFMKGMGDNLVWPALMRRLTKNYAGWEY